MRLFTQKQGKKTRGQTMVEFALVLPLLLFIMFGIMELGRLLFIYITTISAAREATRYASAVEVDSGSTVERYRDCDGIIAAANRVDVLGAIQSVNINYFSDYGGPSQISRGSCPPGNVGPTLNLGDQVVVVVNGNFDLIVPIIPINTNTITSESARTVIKDVPLSVQIPAVAPTGIPSIQPPWTYFPGTNYDPTHGWDRKTYIFISENDPTYLNPNYFRVPIIVTKQDGSQYTEYPVRVTYQLSGEAINNNDYVLLSPNPIQINNGQGYINIGINDDNDYEYYERIIINLISAVTVPDDSSVSPSGNVIWPSTYVIYIIDDDRIPPVVEFADPSSQVSEAGSPSFEIYLKMDKLSQRDTQVPIMIDIDATTARLGYDFIPRGWNFDPENPYTTVVIPANTIPDDVDLYPLLVDIFDDSIFEGPLDVVFVLGRPVNGALDVDNGQNTHILTITDNEDSALELSCSNYSLGIWDAPNNRAWMRIPVNNNDPNSAPVYIQDLTVSWTGNPTSQTWYLGQIEFGIYQIWHDPTFRTTSPFTSDWPTLSLIRQLPVGSKNLVFTTSRSGPVPTGITVRLDNGCVCQIVGQPAVGQQCVAE